MTTNRQSLPWLSYSPVPRRPACSSNQYPLLARARDDSRAFRIRGPRRGHPTSSRETPFRRELPRPPPPLPMRVALRRRHPRRVPLRGSGSRPSTVARFRIPIDEFHTGPIRTTAGTTGTRAVVCSKSPAPSSSRRSSRRRPPVLAKDENRPNEGSARPPPRSPRRSIGGPVGASALPRRRRGAPP